MSKLSKQDVAIFIQNNPGISYEDYVKWAKEANPAWKKNAPRFYKRCDKLYKQALEINEIVEEVDEGPIIGGMVESPDKRRKVAQGKTFVLTCAQSNTKIHNEFLKSILNYCEHRGAELHVSRFTYNKSNHGKKSVKADTLKSSDFSNVWYDDKLEPYFSDDSLQLADGLIWCGELNITPTRVNPISGFQNYTRSSSCILPHTKMFMESVPTMKNNEPKFVYTTGAITQRNYIQKAAGQKADFHHVFGALVVEVDEEGTWWCRQLNANNNGCFYDLTTYYTPEGILEDQSVYAMTHGDLHGHKLDQEIASAVFDPNGIVDQLQPTEQYFHDTVDFMPRNHHNMKDPVHFIRMHKNNTDNVEEEFAKMGVELAGRMYRDYCTSYVVVSNHDQAINTWLNNIHGATDPSNAIFWYEQNAQRLRHCNEKRYSPFTHTLLEKFRDNADETQDDPIFLMEDDSHMMLGEIETALHGHLGPNGARGTPRNLRNAGKVNSGHTHSAGIFEGVYTCGVYGELDMGYNKGLSSWSQSFILTYANAKRTICTFKKGRAWR